MKPVKDTTPLLARTQRRVLSNWRRAVVMSSCMFLQMVTCGIGYGLSVSYVEVIREFESTRAEASVIQSSYLGILLSGAILWTPVIEKLGLGGSIIIGTIVSTAGLVVSTFASNVAMIIAFTGVVAGSGMSLAYFATFLTVSSSFSENRGVALAVLTSGSSIGQCAMPYVFELLIEEFYLNGSFMIAAGIVLNCLPCGAIIHFSSKYFDKDVTLSTRKRTGVCDVSLLKDGVILILLFCNILIMMTGPIESWFLVDMMVLRGYPRGTGSFLVSLVGFVNFFGRVIGGLVLYSKRVHEFIHAAYLCLTVGITHGLILYIQDYAALVGVCVPYGFAVGALIAQYPSLVLRVVPLEKYRQALALWNLTLGAGFLSGGIIGGSINDLTGSYDLLFQFAMGCSVFLFLTYIILLCYLQTRSKTKYSKLEGNNTFEEDVSSPMLVHATSKDDTLYRG